MEVRNVFVCAQIGWGVCLHSQPTNSTNIASPRLPLMKVYLRTDIHCTIYFTSHWGRRFTRSLSRALENLYLRFTGCVGTGMWIELRCKIICRFASFILTLCISLSRLFTFPQNHSVRGLANDSPLENPVSRYKLLLLPRQAGWTQHSSLKTVTTVANFPE
jgi:hypothetical protein